VAQDTGREPNREDLATRLGHSTANIDLALRAGQNYRTASLDDDSRPVFAGAAVDPGLVACESRLLIDRLLLQLEASERRLIRWRFWDDRSQAEIAQDIGVSQMQVSRLLARALTHLRQLYADGDPALALTVASSRTRRRRSKQSSAACDCQGVPGEVVTGPGPAPASAA
jgi:RNA polymerase sigma-B factor